MGSSMMGNMNDELTDVINGILWSEKSSDKKDKYKWDYQTVGKRKYIDKFSQILDDDVTRELDIQRISDIEKSARLSLADLLLHTVLFVAMKDVMGITSKLLVREVVACVKMTLNEMHEISIIALNWR